MLQNIGDNIMQPKYNAFKTASTSLMDKTTAFVNNPTEETLSNAQLAWTDAMESWSAVEVFSTGPVEQMMIKEAIYSWPVKTAAVEENITNAPNEINAEYINSLPAVDINTGLALSQGLAVVEYLLFGKDLSTTEVLASFSDEQRLAYLQTLTEVLAGHATSITEALPEFLPLFVSADGKDVGSSTNMIANDLLIMIETMKNEKVGIPLGKKSLGQPLPLNVEALFSRHSLPLLMISLESTQELFIGKEGLGYDDYLNEVDARINNTPLSEVILAQFQACKTAAEAINDPLEVAITSEKENVENLYNELKKLVTLTKSDMMSQLGLSVTFSDNDGD
ncbi:hypothetical protein GCM10023331_21760 [Algivirga pacifica]|uniref:Imelysin-like domain-containing protein n=2 Tax=Algivirga pacifica TaxID=1162670 RepID=A0ABP9DFL8_9BACT